MCKGHLALAGSDRRQVLVFLGVVAHITNQPAGQNDRSQIGLNHQAATEVFHHHHGVDGVAIQTAKGFGEGERQQAHIRQGGPGVRVGAIAGFDEGAALFKAVLVGHKAAQRVVQHLLFVGKIEIHKIASFKDQARAGR